MLLCGKLVGKPPQQVYVDVGEKRKYVWKKQYLGMDMDVGMRGLRPHRCCGTSRRNNHGQRIWLSPPSPVELWVKYRYAHPILHLRGQVVPFLKTTLITSAGKAF